MRILYLTNHLRETDGWGRYSLTLVREMQRRGHKVFVAVETVVPTKENLQQRACLSGYSSYILNSLTCRRSAKKIQALVKEFQPDVVHVIVEPYANILPFLRLDPKTRVILTIHGTFSYSPNLFKNPLKKFLARQIFLKALARVNTVISISSFTRKYFEKNFAGRKIPRIEVISNGVEIPAYSAPALAPAKNKTEDAGLTKILFVGAIKKRKGVRELIESLKYYQDHFSTNFLCNLVGFFDPADSYYQELRDLIEKYALAEKVIFRGRISEIELDQAYEASTLFVLLPINNENQFEGFGLVYLEANARGLPVIGAEDSGATDAVKDGFSGFSVDSKDPKAVCEAINKIVNGKKIRPEDCRAWAAEHSIDRVAERVLAQYNRE